MKDWVSHFASLLNNSFKPNQNLASNIDSFMKNNKDKVFNELNFSITKAEVFRSMRSLKMSKAAGIDGILNEMIKAGANTLLDPFCSLFNKILAHQHFPKAWRTSTLSPLYKKGDCLDTNNYRGIAVSSSLSKLFLSILQKRLLDFSSKHSLIPECQIGYKPNTCTSDHILTLKNIIDKYIKRSRRTLLFVCFVDFKSAFDTVWRNAMLYKLLKMGIGGNFLGVIESMYQDVLYCVKIEGYISETIKSSVGVKQGCVLSPLLFNLFLSDLPDIFSDSCDPVNLHGTLLNCIMFADDLVLMSETAEGLQACLNNLNEYCEKWGLRININKTKIIIFNKGGHAFSRYKFYLNNVTISIVQQYCYLGIVFSSSGNFGPACKSLYDKALKAFHKFKQINPRNNATLAMKLFDMLISPIISYAGIVWGPCLLGKINHENFMQKCDNAPVEQINIKLCKYLLGVHKYASNIAVKSELGRFPLMIKILHESAKYLCRIKSMNNNSLVKLSCLDTGLFSNEHQNVPSENIYWCHMIMNVMNTFPDCIYSKSGMQLTYKQNWNSYMDSIGDDNKLRTYKLFKKEFILENYVAQFPVIIRRNLSKLRISAHQLAIETGRHNKPQKIPIDKRTCFYCGSIETELHFLLECALYNTERKSLVESLNKFTVVDLKPTSESLILVMSTMNGDTEVSSLVCKYINDCKNLRTEVIINLENNRVGGLQPSANSAPIITRSGRVSKRPQIFSI